MIVAVILFGYPATGEVPAPSFFPLQQRWSTDLAQPAVAPPVYDDGHAYVPLRDGTLVAVSLVDGSITWSTERPTQVSPAVGDGVVVVAHEETLFGLRATDATALWSTELGAAVSAPLLWNTGWVVAVLENGDVVALRGADGLELWRRPVSGQLDVRPSVGGAELFLSVRDGRVLALKLETGELLWERLLGGSPQEILPLDDLFVGATDNYFYRLSRADGKMRWRWRTGGDIVGLPAVDERHVMFVSLDNILWALDRKSGVLQWRHLLPGRPTGGPQIVAEMVLISGVSPVLRAFYTRAGQEAGVLTAPGEFASPPYLVRPPSALAPGLIVMTGDGRLVGLLQPTGPSQFSLDFPPPPLLPEPEMLALDDILPLPVILEAEPAPSPLESGELVHPVHRDGVGANDPFGTP